MFYPVRGLLALMCAVLVSRADEGLWLYNQFPKQTVKSKYNVDVTDEFLRKLQLASVRFNSGGSGSFVSPNGLLFTNHHVGADCIQKLSSKDHDYVKDGFSAKDFSEEKTCPDLEVNVLLKMEEVTGKVTEGVPDNASAADANRIRRANMAKIEKECTAETSNRCDVVSLFSGGRYDLYQYKKYTDVRLVFAPEFAIAFFGGDADNFEYPRYVLDIAFFRAYENGKPVQSPNYFPWSKEGAKEGELTFVSGHPGTTQRLATVANLEFARDIQIPTTLHRLDLLMKALTEYGKQGPEQMRQRNDLFFGASNSFKAYTGFLRGLKDPALMEKKRQEEAKLKDAVLSDPAKKAKYGDVWDRVAASFNDARGYYKNYYCYENAAVSGSELMYVARTLYRASEEFKKPNGERLKEFNDSAKSELEQMLFSQAPVHPELEIAVLTENLRHLVEQLGSDDPVVKQLLVGKTPREVAESAVKSSKLADIELRRKLYNNPGTFSEIQDDGVLRLVRILDGPARENRRKWEDGVLATQALSAGKIAQARYDAYGSNEYPDATFTLRLTYGPAKGYTGANGRKIPWATEIGGTYKHATGKEPLKLPQSWVKAKSKLNLKTPFNFVTSDDIHGGNSGSPTLNAKGEVIGIIFDGNMESLPNRYVYEDDRARAVHVAGQGIIEALRNVYHADRVLKELQF